MFWNFFVSSFGASCALISISYIFLFRFLQKWYIYLLIYNDQLFPFLLKSELVYLYAVLTRINDNQAELHDFKLQLQTNPPSHE